MHIFRWKDNNLDISPEFIGIKPFRDIWKKDRSVGRENSFKIFTLIFFMYDPRSDYQFYTDEKERFDIVKKHIGISDSWSPDSVYKEAVAIYKQISQTTASVTLQKNREVLTKIDKYLDEVTIDDDNATKVIKVLSDKNDLAVKIENAERKIHTDLDEANLSKNTNITIGDEGLESLFKETK
jgi:K+/H+ antiporter YhaU regulatory subunit KhtT